MLTAAFYTHLAAEFVRRDPAVRLFVAVGSGEDGWDDSPPELDRSIAQLSDEVARLVVPPEQIVFLGQDGRPVQQPTPILRLSVTFEAGNATGTLRECGLFGGDATEEPDSGTLLSYYVHPRLEMEAGGRLARTVRLDLTPRPYAPGARVTRWLGNSASEELHDLANQQPGCQIDEIRFDRGHYFATEGEAEAAGYDRCAYCFGRDQSTR